MQQIIIITFSYHISIKNIFSQKSMKRIQNKQPIHQGWSLGWLGTQIKKLWNNEQSNQQQKLPSQSITNMKHTDNKKLEMEQKKEQNYELEDEKTKVLNQMRKKKFKNKQHFQDKMKRVYRYFNRKQNLMHQQNFMQSEEVIEQKYKSADLECAICLYYFVKPVTTICGHSFCIRCLDQTLLIKSQCPSCRNYLRGTKLVQCQSLQKLSLRQIQKHSNEQIEYYNETVRQTLDWLDKRRIDFEKLRINDQVDAKDTQYIWCKAQVKQIYMKYNQPQSVLVHYIGWNSIYDQIIDVNSDRLANCGFYTGRNNIPHYRLDQNGERMYSYVVTNDRQYNILMNQNQVMPGALNFQMLNNMISDMNINQQNFQIRSLQVIFQQSVQSQEYNLSQNNQINNSHSNIHDSIFQQDHFSLHEQGSVNDRDGDNGDSFSASSFGAYQPNLFNNMDTNLNTNNLYIEEQKMNFSFGQTHNNQNMVDLIQNFQQQIQEHQINLFNTNFLNTNFFSNNILLQKYENQNMQWKWQNKFEKEQQQKEQQIKNPEEKIQTLGENKQIQTHSEMKSQVQFIRFGCKKSKEQQDKSLI